MIKVKKDLNNIPDSLNSKPETLSGHARTKARTTYVKRLEHIRAKKYINDDNHNKRYKINDIRESLEKIYNGKCAYCETKVEQYHVDHYRPKVIYYWLAYSWDNLIISCPKCNENKNDLFDIHGGQRASFRTKCIKLNDINKISARYDIYERPKLINVETFDPYPHLIFDRFGKIFSTDSNVSHTIKQCKVDRKWLNDERKKILDDVEKSIETEITANTSPQNQDIAIKALIRDFLIKSMDKKNQYSAFREFHIQKNTLNQIIHQLLA